MAPLAKRLFAKYKHTSNLFWYDYNQSHTKLDHPGRFQTPLPFCGTQFINLEKTGRMGLWPRCLPHKNKLYYRQQQLSRSFTQWLNLVYKDILGSCGSNRQLWPPPYFDWPSPHCMLPTSSASMPQMTKWQQYGVDWENCNKIVNDQMTDLSTKSNLSKRLACVTHILKAVAEVHVGKTKPRQTLLDTSCNSINLCPSL